MEQELTRESLKLLSLREAAALLGIEPAAVRRLVDEGHIGAYRSGTSGVPRIPRRSLEVWVERVAQGLAPAPLSASSTRPSGLNAGQPLARTSSRKRVPPPRPISLAVP